MRKNLDMRDIPNMSEKRRSLTVQEISERKVSGQPLGCADTLHSPTPNGKKLVTGTIHAISYQPKGIYVLLWNGENGEDCVLIRCYCETFFPAKHNEQVKLIGTFIFEDDKNHALIDAYKTDEEFDERATGKSYVELP